MRKVLRARIMVGMAVIVSLAMSVGLCAGCSRTAAVSSSVACSARRSDKICVVTTTGVLRDMIAHIAGDAATVASIIPDNADPPTSQALRQSAILCMPILLLVTICYSKSTALLLLWIPTFAKACRTFS